MTTLHTIACTVRNTGGGFALIDDTAHLPIGVDRRDGAVTHTTAGAIKVLFDQTYGKVGAIVVGPDERMAAEGVVCGASVGLSWFLIFCYRDGVQLDPAAMDWSGSNLWVTGTMIT
jgi:hypothetical protein